MLDLDTVTYDIEQWMATFVEVPHPALGGWAPCPYARRARLDRDFEVRVGINPYFDLRFVSQTGINKSVTIFAPLLNASGTVAVKGDRFVKPISVILIDAQPRGGNRQTVNRLYNSTACVELFQNR